MGHAGWLLISALTLTSAACSGPAHVDQQSARTCDPSGSTRAPRIAERDLAHFIYHNAAFYYARLPQKGPVPALAERLGVITCTVVGSATPDVMKPMEGSAGFILADTPFFKLRDCPATVAIAARWEGPNRGLRPPGRIG
jgi:hypothetical protein